MPPNSGLVMRVEMLGLDKLHRQLIKAGALAEEALAAAGFEIMSEVIAVAKTRVPVDMGILRDSGVVLPPIVRGTKVEILGGFGGAASAYAVVIHEGRKPGSKPPPIQAIKEWARRHGMDEGAAYPIARKIGESGFKNHPNGWKYLESAFLERSPKMAVDLAEGVRFALQRLRVGGG